MSCRDVVMPVVPMFHANGWSIALTAPMTGAGLVMPGPKLDGASIYELLTQFGVTCTAAVPTIWLMLLQHLETSGGMLPQLRKVVIGGAACPRALLKTFKEDHGIDVTHGWGMTEMSPVGTINTPKAKHASLSTEQKLELGVKQGRPPYGVDIRIVGAGNRELPRDGKSAGDVQVRGPWIMRRYYRNEGGDPLTPDGWLPTGDVGTLDADGYLQITDRSKDVIKSGGEWISSIELENIAVGHPAVAEAAVIGVAHPKWGERPLLVVVKKPQAKLTRDAMLAFYGGRTAKWSTPADVVFVDELPHTATGKLSKVTLRERFRDYRLPER